jgi:hypothetical protein
MKIPDYINHKNEIHGLPDRIDGGDICSVKNIKYGELSMDWSDFEVNTKTTKVRKWFKKEKTPRLKVVTPMIKKWDIKYTIHMMLFGFIPVKMPMKMYLRNFQINLQTYWWPTKSGYPKFHFLKFIPTF